MDTDIASNANSENKKKNGNNKNNNKKKITEYQIWHLNANNFSLTTELGE